MKVSLDDKYSLDKGRAFMTGIEALVRLPMLQHQRDLERGLNTACFISGYRGSPLGAVDGLIGIGFHLLGAQYCRGCEIFIHSREKFDVVLVEKRFGAPEFLIDGAWEQAITIAGFTTTGEVLEWASPSSEAIAIEGFRMTTLGSLSWPEWYEIEIEPGPD